MNAVLSWIKLNIYTVIFVAVMIAAPVALWIVSGNMNAAVQEEVQTRAAKMKELEKFERTSVKLANPVPKNPPVQATIAVNRRFLDRYQEVVRAIRQDADRVREEVLNINQKDRGVLLQELFPEPPTQLRETLPRRMYQSLRAAYEELVKSVGAGSPPPVDQMQDDLAAAKERLTTQILKRSTDALTEEEQAWLTEQLTETRLSYYAEAANGLKLYATPASLDMPRDEAEAPDVADDEAMILLFDWQWRYWIAEDVLKALARANEPYESVVTAPVKRVESMFVLDEPGTAAPAVGGRAGGAGTTAGFGAAGSSGRRSKGGGSPASKGGGIDANPSREVPLDYSLSFTGRTTNPLFDVRQVELVLVVDSAKIPEVFDALARENFITVTDLRLETVDLYEAIRDGYFYGTAPVSRLTLQLETIWIREWTTPYMPAGLKEALGIPVEPKKTG